MPLLLAAGLLAAVPIQPAQAEVIDFVGTFDADKFALQIMQRTNAMRQDPTILQGAMASLKKWGSYQAALPNGFLVDTKDEYRVAATKEALAQTPQTPLKWSAKLAAFAKERAVLLAPSGNVDHGNFSQRTADAGLSNNGVSEFIGPSTLDPDAEILGMWISSDEWAIGSDWSPDDAPGRRGHRGAINRVGATAIGIRCAESPMFNHRRSVICVTNQGIDLPDEGTTPPSAGGAPDLSALTQPLTTTIGTAPDPSRATLTVPLQPPSPTATPPTEGNRPLTPPGGQPVASQAASPPPKTATSTPPTSAPTPAATSAPAAPASTTAAPAPSAPPSTTAAGGRCVNRATPLSKLSNDDAVNALRCLIDETRTNAGLVPMSGGSKFDDSAGGYTASGRIRPSGYGCASGEQSDFIAPPLVEHSKTPEAALKELGGLARVGKGIDGYYLGLGFSQNFFDEKNVPHYGVIFVKCK